MNRRRDIITGAVLLLLGAAYHATAAGFRRTLLSDRIGAGGFPKLLAASLMLLSLVLILRAVLHPGPGKEELERRRQAWCRDRGHFASAAGLLALGALYLALVPWTGYGLGIGLFLLAILRYQREPVNARTVLFSAAGALCLWLFFVRAMSIPMPEGVWSAVLGWTR